MSNMMYCWPVEPDVARSQVIGDKSDKLTVIVIILEALIGGLLLVVILQLFFIAQ